MGDVVKILYNGTDAFYPQPTPFVGVGYDAIYFGEKWGQKETITLNGQITGCSFGNIISGYDNLVKNFKNHYQNLEIWQIEGTNSGCVAKKELVEVESISIPDNRWVGAMPYSITLTCYPSGFFSGAFGVLEPADVWNFSENENATMNISHAISCRPFNTSRVSNNAIENGRAWAFSKSGLASFVSPLFINGSHPENFFLVSQNENIDRFNGTYSLNETYSNDLARIGYGIIRYETTIDSGNGIISISLNGNAQGGGQNISKVRVAFENLDKTAVVAKQYKDIFGMDDLNPIPLTKSFSENPLESKIDFSYVYNNENVPEVTFDYDVSLSSQLDGNITASINGTVRVRGGSLQEKLTKAISYSTGVNLYNLVIPFYSTFDALSAFPLNKSPISSTYSINQSNGTVSLGASFDNKNKMSPVFEEFDVTINSSPPLIKIDSQPILDRDGHYSTVNLGYAERGSFSINGVARVGARYSSDAGISSVKSVCYSLFSQYSRGAAILERNSISENKTNPKILNFSFVWLIDRSPSGPVNVSL